MLGFVDLRLSCRVANSPLKWYCRAYVLEMN